MYLKNIMTVKYRKYYYITFCWNMPLISHGCEGLYLHSLQFLDTA